MSLTQIPAKLGRALMKKYSKKGKGRRRARRTNMPKAPTGSFASRKEQFSLAIQAGVSYDFDFNINDLIVSKQLATLYQYYRITDVELRFKPAYDTFQAQATDMVPYLYFQYDKSGDLGGLTAPQFEELGTKAIRFDDKTIVRKWKPSVATTTDLGTTQFKVAPWMPTHDPIAPGTLNVVDHHGAVFYISKMSAGDVLGYDVDVIVNVQFRKPLVVPGSSAVKPTRMVQTNVSGVPAGVLPTITT